MFISDAEEFAPPITNPLMATPLPISFLAVLLQLGLAVIVINVTQKDLHKYKGGGNKWCNSLQKRL